MSLTHQPGIRPALHAVRPPSALTMHDDVLLWLMGWDTPRQGYILPGVPFRDVPRADRSHPISVVSELGVNNLVLIDDLRGWPENRFLFLMCWAA